MSLMDISPLPSFDFEAILNGTNPVEEAEPSLLKLEDLIAGGSSDELLGDLILPDPDELEEFPCESPTAILNPLPASNSSDGGTNSSGAHTTTTTDAAAPAPKATRGRKPRLTEAERKERIREKNRRGQERHRLKKKQMLADKEAAVEAATEDLERLRLENERLANANALKQQVLHVKDTAAALLEGARQIDEPPIPAHVKNLLQFHQVKSSVGVQLPPPVPATSSCSTAERADSHDNNNESDCPSSSATAATALPSLEVLVAMRRDAISSEVIAEKFGLCHNRLKQALEILDDDDESEENRQRAETIMNQTLMHTSEACSDLALHQPTELQIMMAANVGRESGDVEVDASEVIFDGIGIGDDRMMSRRGTSDEVGTAQQQQNLLDEQQEQENRQRWWAGVVRQLHLSPLQRAELIKGREVFLQKAKRVAEARCDILNKLQTAASGGGLSALLPASPPSLDTTGDGDNAGGAAHPASTTPAQGPTTNTTNTGGGGTDADQQQQQQHVSKIGAGKASSSDWLAIHAATQELSLNLYQEHLLCLELLAAGCVLTPVQKARILVKSYPALPDVLAMATAAKNEAAMLGGGDGGDV